MSDLPTVKVSECCDILDNLRIPLNAEEREKTKGNIPYCGANGIQGYISEYIFDEDLILLAEDGGNFDEYQTRPIAYRISGKSWVNNHAHVLRAKEGYDFSFVFYSLQHKNIIPFIKGGTRAKLNQAELREITIWDAPLPIQQRIGEIIETIDNQIETTQALIDKYTAIKQGMMADLFSRGIDPETKALRPTFEDAPELYHKTPLGMLPKGWELVRTETVAREVVVGIVIEPSKYYTSEGVPVFRSANIQENKINPRNFVHMSEESNQLNRKSMLRTGDVITVRTGYPGTTCVVTEEYDRSNAVDIIITRLGENVIPDFFSLWVNSDSGKGQVLSAQGGLAQQHFNVGEMKNLLVPRISLSEQELILKTARSLLKKIELETHHLLKLKLQKQGLMQDLLTGKVPVPA